MASSSTAMPTIALLSTSGLGPKTVSRAYDVDPDSMYGGVTLKPEAMIDLIKKVKEQYSRTRVPTQSQIEKGIEQAAMVIDRCAEEGIGVITRADQRFPTSLLKISDAPSILYYRGEVSSLHHRKCVTIVGTRKPSSFGRSCSRRLAEMLANEGFTIVSGLALGSDQAAHEGCLDVRGTTIAFMAHGLDRISPRSNEQLAQEILDSGGCLASEYPPGVPPQRRFYVKRNRLQSGLSPGTIIIETARKGGTMHTARFALKQGKILGCLVHPACEQGEHCEGNEILLHEKGAIPIGGPAQIEAFLRSISFSRLESGDSPSKAREAPEQLSIFPNS